MRLSCAPTSGADRCHAERAHVHVLRPGASVPVCGLRVLLLALLDPAHVLGHLRRVEDAAHAVEHRVLVLNVLLHLGAQLVDELGARHENLAVGVDLLPVAREGVELQRREVELGGDHVQHVAAHRRAARARAGLVRRGGDRRRRSPVGRRLVGRCGRGRGVRHLLAEGEGDEGRRLQDLLDDVEVAEHHALALSLRAHVLLDQRVRLGLQLLDGASAQQQLHLREVRHALLLSTGDRRAAAARTRARARGHSDAAGERALVLELRLGRLDVPLQPGDVVLEPLHVRLVPPPRVTRRLRLARHAHLHLGVLLSLPARRRLRAGGGGGIAVSAGAAEGRLQIEATARAFEPREQPVRVLLHATFTRDALGRVHGLLAGCPEEARGEIIVDELLHLKQVG
mmetsp:Transcript_25316/g.65399  ORF Transcript_25316/g.65399 Transcript_25316/m.65399 type:complete len:398 (+) Transcript_25316:205-1398(+)